MPCYTFGSFSLDARARILLRNGKPVPMAGKTFDTLLVLVQNRGRLMDKDELLAKIWPGTVVEEANLSQNIFTIRKILGDRPKDHRYIATVAGRGYQFVAPVSETAAESSQAPPFWRRNLAIRTAAVVLVVALAATAWFVLRRPSKFAGELMETRLTFNSGSNSLGSGVISPDGVGSHDAKDSGRGGRLESFAGRQAYRFQSQRVIWQLSRNLGHGRRRRRSAQSSCGGAGRVALPGALVS